MPNTVTISVPDNSSVKIDGFTNSASWTQQITVSPSCQASIVWTGTGAQDNKLVGQLTVPPGVNKTVTIAMAFNSGSGFVPSAVVSTPFEAPGIAGYVIGGQDAGGRPSGPASWNTVAFIYWAKGY
jgi:hypothetical protein